MRSLLRRGAAVVTLALGAAVLPGAPAQAQGDTAAVAINTKDGFDIFRLAFQIRHATGDVVDTSNGAVAYASCTDCQTVALAIQVLLISGFDSSTVAPENIAIAINENCVACETLASAYQFVLTAEGNVRFTAEGRQRLTEIRRALLALRAGVLSVVEIQTKLDALMDDLAQVLSTELVAAGAPGGASPTASPSGSGTGTASPTSGASAAPSSEPSGSAGPSESASPSAEPSATSSASAEPTP